MKERCTISDGGNTMHINPTQLKQVDRQVRRLISCGNFYGTKLKEAGVDGVSSGRRLPRIAFFA